MDYENNNNGEQFTEQAKATAEVYEQEVTRLTAERDGLVLRVNNLETLLRRAEDRLSHLTSIVQDEFDKGGWDEDDEFFLALCQYLDIETTVETEVTVTATWNITVRHPRGYDVENELSVDVSLDVDGRDCDIDNDPYPDVEVSAN